MPFNKLTEDEIRVIEKKELKDHFLVNIMIFMMKVFLHVRNVTQNSIHLKVNLIQDVDGLVLMMI